MKYIHLTRHQNQRFKKQPTHHLGLKIYTQTYIHIIIVYTIQNYAEVSLPKPAKSSPMYSV